MPARRAFQEGQSLIDDLREGGHISGLKVQTKEAINQTMFQVGRQTTSIGAAIHTYRRSHPSYAHPPSLRLGRFNPVKNNWERGSEFPLC